MTSRGTRDDPVPDEMLLTRWLGSIELHKRCGLPLTAHCWLLAAHVALATQRQIGRVTTIYLIKATSGEKESRRLDARGSHGRGGGHGQRRRWCWPRGKGAHVCSTVPAHSRAIDTAPGRPGLSAPGPPADVAKKYRRHASSVHGGLT